MKPFLSIKEASEYLGLEYKTVYRLVRAGEIPAARLGGVYRIKLADLESYFEQQKQRVVSQSGESLDTLFAYPALAHCGRCLRIIQRLDQIGGKCAQPDCSETVCQECWVESGARYCSRHEPGWAENLKSAQEKRLAGQGPAPVAAERAREMELAYLGRFDSKVCALKSIANPLTGKETVVANWEAIHQSTDQTSQLARLAAQQGTPDSVLPRMPRNATSRYTLLEANQKRMGVILSASCHARLETLLRSGVDSAPLSLSELLELLQEQIRAAENQKCLSVHAFASPTGWANECIEYIGGGDRNRVFHHRLILSLLVDLSSGQVYRDQLDDRLAGLEPLFLPQLRHEQVEQARAYAEQWVLNNRHSLTAAEAAQALGVPVAFVDEAFAQMSKDERFVLVDLPNTGKVIGLRD